MDAARSATVREDSPGKNTGVDYYAILQGIVPTQGSNPGLPPWRRILGSSVIYFAHAGWNFICLIIFDWSSDIINLILLSLRYGCTFIKNAGFLILGGFFWAFCGIHRVTPLGHPFKKNLPFMCKNC